MIILHQHHWVSLTGDLLQHSVGEPLVNGAVEPPVLRAENRPRVCDVAERPQPLVGKSEVESLFLFRSEPDAA